MDFSLSEERQLLSDSLTRYLSDQYPIEHRIQAAYSDPYFDPLKWQELVELGVPAALVSEENGGFGGTGSDISLVFAALGGALASEPFLALVMASRLLNATGQNQEAIVTGATKYAAALSEPDAPYDLSDIVTTASDEHRLSGRKSAVYGGHVADTFLVAAKHEGVISLYEVLACDAEIIPYGLIDGGGAAEVLLDNTPAKLVLNKAEDAIQSALNAGVLALCAEAVGAMNSAYETTLDYLKQRKQFGRPIGSFQVLQHRAVDMLTEIEQARSITIKAAAELDGPDASRFVSMAKNLIGRSSRLIAEEAIQMHGGIAMTWEYSVSHYAKRLIMLDHQLGDSDYHLTKIMHDL